MLPNLKKNLLQNIIRFRLFVNDARNDRFQGFAVTLVQLAQGNLVARGDRLHQSFVGGFGQA